MEQKAFKELVKVGKMFASDNKWDANHGMAWLVLGGDHYILHSLSSYYRASMPNVGHGNYLLASAMKCKNATELAILPQVSPDTIPTLDTYDDSNAVHFTHTDMSNMLSAGKFADPDETMERFHGPFFAGGSVWGSNGRNICTYAAGGLASVFEGRTLPLRRMYSLFEDNGGRAKLVKDGSGIYLCDNTQLYITTGVIQHGLGISRLQAIVDCKGMMEFMDMAHLAKAVGDYEKLILHRMDNRLYLLPENSNSRKRSQSYGLCVEILYRDDLFPEIGQIAINGDALRKAAALGATTVLLDVAKNFFQFAGAEGAIIVSAGHVPNARTPDAVVTAIKESITAEIVRQRECVAASR